MATITLRTLGGLVVMTVPRQILSMCAWVRGVRWM